VQIYNSRINLGVSSLSKEPNMPAKEPYMSAKEPCISSTRGLHFLQTRSSKEYNPRICQFQTYLSLKRMQYACKRAMYVCKRALYFLQERPTFSPNEEYANV